MEKGKLKAVIATLETISVSGRANLNALLACIQTLEKLLEKEHDDDA